MVSSFVLVSCHSALRRAFSISHVLRARGLSFLSFRVEPFWDFSPPGPGVGRSAYVGMYNLYIYGAGAYADDTSSLSRSAYGFAGGCFRFADHRQSATWRHSH